MNVQQKVDRLREEFVRAWKAGNQPSIEDNLGRIDEAARASLLKELILAELEIRSANAAPANMAEYHQRFADHEEIVMDAFQSHRGLESHDPSSTMDRFDSVANGPSQDTERRQCFGRYVVRRHLGRGAFGDVYLAHDPEIDRLVALKVPRAERFASQAAFDGFLREARTAARLDHPGIVKVYDVNRDSGDLVIVLEYVEGRTLADAIVSEQFSCEQTASLVGEIARAVNDANEAGLVHRDLKPANVLLDKTGRARVTDFGLAVHEDAQHVHNLKSAGTPAYMAPEQVRGETHRLDGRTDQWSLGVILYEMLTGRRPFVGATRSELFDEIKNRNPKPPRQIIPSIAPELERICLKCLSQRMPDRYTTLSDLADDLQHWLDNRTRSAVDSADGLYPIPVDVNEHPPHVIPKGLRSFDEHDADFFLQLLPGPFDRDGLPESLRFWKNRITERDTDRTFSVGLIYGPSGCGKSSLVKAGLLPLLGETVCTIYVEATPDDTEARLLRGLRKYCVDLPPDMSLPDALAALREGGGPTHNRKILIVLDQFEQWLHGGGGETDTQLLDALRHCDGSRVQCIVMVRVDFWLAVSRFMKQLEIRIVEDENSTLVDLFHLDHARSVLAAFGRAFGRLPEDPGQSTEDQKLFLDRAVKGLADDGKVICVRLALFAQMMKDKAWVPKTLTEVGGTQGICGSFLEETFNVPTAPPEHRKHQKAARAVLNALLPELGTDIKGHMRSHDELIAASGYIDHSGEFENLIRILDRKLRLITPTDPDGTENYINNADISASGAATNHIFTDARPQHFQLTHDYLVPSLRQWLTRKQQETIRGRAELKLVERTALWNAHRERKQLPTFYEWFVIRLLTSKQQWAESERTMMAAAGWQRLVLLSFLLGVAAILGAGCWSYELFGQRRAEHLVDQLAAAETDQTRGLFLEIEKCRHWVNDPLYDGLSAAFENDNSRQQMNFLLALAPIDKSQVKRLIDLLLAAEPGQFVFLSRQLYFLREDLREPLWSILETPDKQCSSQILPAAAVLNFCDQWDTDRWDDVGSVVVEGLIDLYVREPNSAKAWAGPLKPAAGKLRPHLEKIMDGSDAEQRDAAAEMLATLFPK